MIDEQILMNYYALLIKGSYYNANGEITEDFAEAKLFVSKEEAISFRNRHDPHHYVDCSQLLAVRIMVNESD